MAQIPIINAAKLSVNYHTDIWPELCTFGLHIMKRDEADWDEMLDAMHDFVLTLGYLYPPSTMETVTYSEWDTGGGFTGWHQRRQIASDDGWGTGDTGPHQLAYVVGYRNQFESSIPLGRRRNRFYLGPLKHTAISSDGRMSPTNRGTLITGVTALHDRIRATPDSLATDPPTGLVVVSAAEGKLFEADHLSVGLRIDTMRSRTQHIPEDPTYPVLEL